MPPLAKVFTQDPNDVLDYPWDWFEWLAAGEQIVDSSFSVAPSGLSIVSETYTSTNATVWLAGGTLNTLYVVSNLITTNQGRTVERSANIRVVNR
jgi:hypothetical protein